MFAEIPINSVPRETPYSTITNFEFYVTVHKIALHDRHSIPILTRTAIIPRALYHFLFCSSLLVSATMLSALPPPSLSLPSPGGAITQIAIVRVVPELGPNSLKKWNGANIGQGLSLISSHNPVAPPPPPWPPFCVCGRD